MRVAILLTLEELEKTRKHIENLGWDSLKEYVAHMLRSVGTVESLQHDVIIIPKGEERKKP